MGLLVHDPDSASELPHDDEEGEGDEDEDDEQLVPEERLWFRWSECGREGVVMSRAGLEL